MKLNNLSDKRKGFIKIPEGKLHEKLKSGYYYGKDVKESIHTIITDIDKLPDKIQFKDSGTKIWVDYREVIKIIKRRAGDELIWKNTK